MKSLSILNEVRQFCEKNSLRMTPPRERVLQIVAEAEKPLGAYDILQRLGAYLDNPKPPTAYRAIEFWQSHGFIHRIESLNAYVTCHAGHRHEGSQYMICDGCGDVKEMHLCTMPEAFQEKAQEGGFRVQRWNTELHGTCAACASQ
jgi:Fur family zinc uptake transcriptional regulator